MYVCMHAFMYVCMYACVYVCMCVLFLPHLLFCSQYPAAYLPCSHVFLLLCFLILFLLFFFLFSRLSVLFSFLAPLFFCLHCSLIFSACTASHFSLFVSLLNRVLVFLFFLSSWHYFSLVCSFFLWHDTGGSGLWGRPWRGLPGSGTGRWAGGPGGRLGGGPVRAFQGGGGGGVFWGVANHRTVGFRMM